MKLSSFILSEYLFDNDKIAGEQRYDRIVDDIRPLMEEGYSVYVTGHRYVFWRYIVLY